MKDLSDDTWLFIMFTIVAVASLASYTIVEVSKNQKGNNVQTEISTSNDAGIEARKKTNPSSSNINND